MADTDTSNGFLRDEYDRLQQLVGDFDARSMQIKGWSVTISLAGMLAALASSDMSRLEQAITFLLAAAASLAFWIIDWRMKLWQLALFGRISDIEAVFRTRFGHGDGYSPAAPFQIRSAFQHHQKKPLSPTPEPDIWKRRTVSLPHSLVMGLGLLLCAGAATDAVRPWLPADTTAPQAPRP